jgi:hypothetical protein
MKKISTTVYVIVVVVVVFVASYYLSRRNLGKVGTVVNKVSETLDLNDGFSFDSSTPGYETYVDLTQGCPFKDCIKSIDNPEFESADVADQWLDGADLVFVLDYKGEARSYSQRILNRHEIVNDEIDSEPVVVTFCPLCGSALAFERTLDGQVLEFGVSGKLHNNDLVMYDRQTESLWQQITGVAIAGELFGTRLKQISFGAMTWEEAKSRYPSIMSLKRPRASSAYDTYPYGDYENDPNPLFPMDTDSTIHPKTVVFGVEVEEEYKAYPEEKLKTQDSKLKDQVGNVAVEIGYNNGDVRVRRLDTGEDVVATRLFWFAWAAFRPETELY